MQFRNLGSDLISGKEGHLQPPCTHVSAAWWMQVSSSFYKRNSNQGITANIGVFECVYYM